MNPAQRPLILQTARLLPSLETALAAEFDCHVLPAEPERRDFLASQGHRFEGMVTSSKGGADDALLAALPGLKVIAHFGVGYDMVDVAAAGRRGVVVSNTPDVLNDCVADLAMGLLIDVARGLSASERFVRRGDWHKGQFPLATRVSGKRLGIAGLGRIGRTIARRAAGFDMEIRYHTRHPVAAVPWPHEKSLSALAQWCDFLMVAVSGGASTRHLVTAGVLDALGPEGFIINIARGSVIDEPALVDALLHQRIAGAALDVFEHEPKVPEALMALDNVVLLPHVASATNETRRGMGELVLNNLRSFFTEKRLLTPVTA
jgi:hydroxypyruvate reductase